MADIDPDTVSLATTMRAEFKALVKKYNDQDVTVAAVTGILATTAYAAAHGSRDSACDLVNAIAADAIDAILDMVAIAEQQRDLPFPPTQGEA
jgi:hypothetical protein